MKMKLIKGLSIFRDLSEECQQDIAIYLKKELYGPKQQVIKKGEIGSRLFIVAHGIVKITDESMQVLAHLQEGECFGEAALIEDAPRNANVFGVTYCDLLVLSKEHFNILVKKHPVLKEQFNKSLLEHSKNPHKKL